MDTNTCPECKVVFTDLAAHLAAELEAMTAQFVRARHTFNNSQLGPKTDRAGTRMQTIMAKAETLGLADELTKALGY